jgi:ribosomal protein S27E
MRLTNALARDGELEGRPSGAEAIRTSMLILSCSDCARSVKVFGKVSRVLCACGRVLLETPSVPSRGRSSRYGDKESR